MKRRIPVVMILVLGLALLMCAGLFAQLKKDARSGQDRLDGIIQTFDKGKATMSVRETGSAAAFWQVAYNDKTVVTLKNNPGKIDDLKEGMRVIVLGKFEKDTLTATRIEIRAEK